MDGKRGVRGYVHTSNIPLLQIPHHLSPLRSGRYTRNHGLRVDSFLRNRIYFPRQYKALVL